MFLWQKVETQEITSVSTLTFFKCTSLQRQARAMRILMWMCCLLKGTETIAPDGCCPVCIPKDHPCNVSTTAVYVESQGCQSKQLINITSCSGACGTFTVYSTKMRSLQHICACCQEVATSKRQIQLSCPDNTEITYTYTHIDACSCLKTECSVPGHSALTTPTSSKSHRRKR